MLGFYSAIRLIIIRYFGHIVSDVSDIKSHYFGFVAWIISIVKILLLDFLNRSVGEMVKYFTY